MNDNHYTYIFVPSGQIGDRVTLYQHSKKAVVDLHFYTLNTELHCTLEQLSNTFSSARETPIIVEFKIERGYILTSFIFPGINLSFTGIVQTEKKIKQLEETNEVIIN
jgi:hypothetical protein